MATPPFTRRIRTALPRIKRSHGFGIHSPFAFSFVTKVLMERTPFYAYSDIARIRARAIRLAAIGRFRHSRVISLKNAKMVFRIAVNVRPAAIFQIGTAYGVTTAALARADSSTPIVVATGHDVAIPGSEPVYRAITRPFASQISEFADFTEAKVHYLSLLPDDATPFIVINAVPDSDDEATKAAVITFIREVIEAGGYIIVRNLARPVNSSVWTEINSLSELSHGMSFTNGKIGIFVGLHHLPHQSFSLWF